MEPKVGHELEEMGLVLGCLHFIFKSYHPCPDLLPVFPTPDGRAVVVIV
jgi:hypothetical protein